MDDEMDQAPPEVTIEPADNGHVVRWHQRSTKKNQSGRTVRRVASTVDEALGHAKSALGGGSATRSRKKSDRAGLASGASEGDGDSVSSPAVSSPSVHAAHSSTRSRARRRRSRVSSRRA